jgi:CubicO group peptidase (beta-lactamase class C family)
MLAVLATVTMAATTAGAAPPPPIPDTPAGRVFAAWLAAFNSADRETMLAFDRQYRTQPRDVEQTLAFREETGGFTLVRVEKSEPTVLTALLAEKGSDTVTRLEMSVTATDPPKMVRGELRVTPRPADMAIPRLGEAEAVAALVARADQLAAADQFAGAVLVARNGQPLLQRAWGLADREAGTPATLDTRFRLGSMNKMFTAVATLQLVQAGKLSLDDPIGKHLTDYPNRDVATKVTVRHLLMHTGGTGDIFGPEFEQNRLSLREHSDYLKLYGARGLTHEPGAEARYSNYGFVLLGALIEKASGQSYYDYVRDHVFEPAGMRSTASLAESEVVPNRSAGYMKRDGRWVSNQGTLPWRGTAAGGGYSTVGDLLRFAQALESGKLLSKELVAEATRAQRPGYGYGFGVAGEGRERSYGHGGGAPGMNGELRVYPELGYVVVALSNLDPPAASRLVDFFALRMPV